jgi:hypothetical protein
MIDRKLIALVAVLVVAVACTSVAVAANTAAAPSKVTIKQKFVEKLKPNRYYQEGLRWDKDVYTVKSGGSVVLQFTADEHGPHTLSAVAAKDMPKNMKQANKCFSPSGACSKVGAAHGADPNSDAPPKFPFVENGKGQATPSNLDRPGDSVLTGEKKGSKVTVKVTAKKGTTLNLLCVLHPQMQAQLKVG